MKIIVNQNESDVKVAETGRVTPDYSWIQTDQPYVVYISDVDFKGKDNDFGKSLNVVLKLVVNKNTRKAVEIHKALEAGQTPTTQWDVADPVETVNVLYWIGDTDESGEFIPFEKSSRSPKAITFAQSTQKFLANIIQGEAKVGTSTVDLNDLKGTPFITMLYADEYGVKTRQSAKVETDQGDVWVNYPRYAIPNDSPSRSVPSIYSGTSSTDDSEF